ncbi:hypothetical protein [Sulfitobacter aestuariivivens]|uniref:hypothetical protein n=1 Tax=Sulfitobacter aestuariivivens TaxID=2766981 RepID=UPI003608579F
MPLPLWWRDDDATRDTMALQRLLGVSEGLDIPVHLAVIPRPATADLAAVIKDAPGAVPLVHGWAHENHAPDGQKKAEFGHPRAAAIDEARSGLRRLKSLFGARLLPMFVPPWNRIDPDIANALPHLGYTALSTYTPGLRAKRRDWYRSTRMSIRSTGKRAVG